MNLASYIKLRGIGLTGGIATGKSTVSRLIREQGFTVYDADILARQAVEPGSETLQALVKLCGETIRAADGSLERKKLGALIFTNTTLRRQVEALIHDRIWQLLARELEPRCAANDPSYWFFDAALLFETDSYKRFNQIWLTTCPEAVQRQRLMVRDHLSPAQVDAILASQFPTARKLALATVIIDTARPLAAVKQTVVELLKSLSENP